MLSRWHIVLFSVWSSVKSVHLKLHMRNTDFLVSVSEMVVIFLHQEVFR